MDERYTFFSKVTAHWGDAFIGTASNSPLFVATFLYPREKCGSDKDCKEFSEHFVGETEKDVKTALTHWLDQEFGPNQYILQLVMLD